MVLVEISKGKNIQRGHIFDIKFKLTIFNDGIEYKNNKKKSDGYSIVHEKKESTIDQGLNIRRKGGIIKRYPVG